MAPPRTVLITGCSDGGLGAALAIAFHNQGHRVFATARNPSKMSHVKELGIATLVLDVLSDESVEKCVAEVSKRTGGSLDVLVNNAGAGYNMPVVDVAIPEVKKLFEINVWSVITTTQAFLPLLLRSQPGGWIVNNTSTIGVFGVPLNGPYCASKAAIAMFTECMRFELQPFGIKVVDLKTGAVRSHFFDNLREEGQSNALPSQSIYRIDKDAIEEKMRDGFVQVGFMDANVWARQVVKDLSRSSPPAQIWRGTSAWLLWLATYLPHGFLNSTMKKMTGLDIVERKIRDQGKESVLSKLGFT